MSNIHIPVRDMVDSIIADYCDGNIFASTTTDSGWVFSFRRAHFLERNPLGEPSLPQQCADRLVAYVESLLEEE